MRFGPFALSPSKRVLERDGVPVRLGGRALDILIALVECAGEIVSKKTLLERVWPGMLVEEGSLRFHIVAIRKALGDDGGEHRVIVNVMNKGYTFVAAVEREVVTAPAPAPPPARRLPALAVAVHGRDDDIAVLVAALFRHRLVTIVGAGGIGKTTAALAVLHAASKQFGGDIHVVDLAPIPRPGSVHVAVAAGIGMRDGAGDPRALETFLAERECVILLDCCEHVVDEAAQLAETLSRNCPRVHILATSRESLRAAGEFAYRLQPLACPAHGEGMTAASALAYPAVRLFVERAVASGAGFTLSDADAPLASQLCRDLGGIALAIELAAGRIEALGLQAVTHHFDSHATLQWHGRRTAPARHQTLRATLDWSYRLLSNAEQDLLCRLSVFTGRFCLDAALDICCAGIERSDAFELVAGLVAKSLVAVDAGGAALRYGLLDTTRSYARSKLRDSGAEADVEQLFAAYFSRRIHDAAALYADDPDSFRLELPDLRAALDWQLRREDRRREATALAAALCGPLLQSSRLAECAQVAEAALAAMPAGCAGSPLELELSGALGNALMFLGRGRRGMAAAAYRRGIEVAEQLGDRGGTLRLLGGYLVLLHREGRYLDALETAVRAQSLLRHLPDIESRITVDALMGVCLHHVGRTDEAMRHWEQCLALASGASGAPDPRFSFEYRIRALCGLARGLWITGSHTEALRLAAETIAEARERGHAVTHCLALIWAGSVYTFAHDADRMHGVAEELERVGKSHSLEPYRHAAGMIHGQVAILRGRPGDGVALLRAAIDGFRANGYEMVLSVALIALAQGLSDLGLHSASLATCAELEQAMHAGGDFLRLPEFLATRGACLAAAGRPAEAEQSYLAAIARARSQGDRSSAVRAAVPLARQWLDSGRGAEAAELLAPLVRQAGAEASLHLAQARAMLEAAAPRARHR